MIKIRILAIMLLSALFLHTSCQKNELEITDNNKENRIETIANDGLIKLGKKLENPYSVTNMKRAYNSLLSKNEIKSNSKEEAITNTHLYVRFLPKDSLENNILINDTTLELFTYPLDYEIVEDGLYYQDPGIPEGEPSWLYTVVPVDFSFPQVEYEIIEKCYIPDEDAQEVKNTEQAEFLAKLEYEAFKITNNLTADEVADAENRKWGLPSKGYPSGRFQVEDVVGGVDAGTFQGVRSVKVRTHRIVKIRSTWTDNDGDYRISTGYRYKVHYSVIFENRTGFKIWGNLACFAPANYGMSWHSKNGYSRNISNNSKAWLWSTINNAALSYRGKCGIFNITPPPSNLRYWSMRSEGNWAGCAPMARHITLGINSLMDFLTIGYAAVKTKGISVALSLCLPDIFILHSGDEDTRRIYETVYHESAHASHYQRVGKTYWLKYIGHITVNLGYGNGDENWAGYAGIGEIWANYFGAICGEDEFGTRDWAFDHFEDWYHPGFYMDLDEFRGFTPQELYIPLTSGINSIELLRDVLIARYPNRQTEINIEFNEYY